MRSLILSSPAIALVLLLAGCGTAAPMAPSPDASPKPVQVAVETNPSPAAMGELQMIFKITDSGGRPIEGARVDVSADHTDMTGMTMGGAATEQSPGTYVITADFTMSGNWLLTVYVRKGLIDYREDIPLAVR